MKKFISLILVVILITSSSIFSFAATVKNITDPKSTQILYNGALSDPTLANKLQNLNLPEDVINDIIINSKSDKYEHSNLQISVSNYVVNESETLFNNQGVSPMSTVYYQSYESNYYNVPLDAIVPGSNSTAISELVVISAGLISSKIGLFAGGMSILMYLNSIWGENSVTPQSEDYVEVDGSLASRIDKYTYCDLNDGSGYRLGLITQKLNNMSMIFETHVFNKNTRTWKDEIVKTLSNYNFISSNYYSPNVKALSNVKLNMSQDERFSITVGNFKFEIK